MGHDLPCGDAGGAGVRAGEEPGADVVHIRRLRVRARSRVPGGVGHGKPGGDCRQRHPAGVLVALIRGQQSVLGLDQGKDPVCKHAKAQLWRVLQ